MLIIITKQLSELLPKDHRLQKHLSLNPTNFQEIFNLFKSQTSKDLCVYDATVSKNIKKGQKFMVKDHVNKTGTNILIGQQKKLCIDFTDISSLYTHKKNSIITTCCGEKLNMNLEYPCHYLCHITTLAKAMQFKTIIGYLYKL